MLKKKKYNHLLRIAVNKKIMEANQSIVEFNSEQITINSQLLDGALKPSEVALARLLLTISISLQAAFAPDSAE